VGKTLIWIFADGLIQSLLFLKNLAKVFTFYVDLDIISKD